MRRILVVEDSRTQAERLRSLLESAGHDVVVSHDADAAVRRLAEGPVDLVLSDVVMPGTDGYGLCRQIKETQPDLPVVLLTSLTDPLEVVNGLSAGADNFLHKPYEPDQLLSRVDAILYNQDMRRDSRANMGLELFFLGRRFMITSERQQLLDLLVTTFEDLVRTNEQLRDGEVQLAAAHDELAQQLRVAELERRRLSGVLSALPVGVIVLGESGEVMDANDALLDLLRLDRAAVVGRSAEDLRVLVDPHGVPLSAARRPLGRAVHEGGLSECGSGFDVFAQRPDGTRVAVTARAAPIHDSVGNVSGVVGLLQEIGGLASHNPLTGLPTHDLLVDRVRQAVSVAATQGLSSAVLVVALDRIERVREAGRRAYDDVVIETANRLRSLLEHRLVAARTLGASLAYLEGGEFAVVLPALREPDDAVRVAELFVDEIGRPAVADGIEIPLDVSVGVFVSADPSVNAAARVSASVQAARAGSRLGGRRVEVADPVVHGRLLGRLGLEAELRRAISSGELVVHYQPQVELATGRLLGAEALVRWQHPQRGLVPPSEFIPLAEESGLVVPLGLVVLREACRQAATWRRELAGAQHFLVSVNIAAEQLEQADVVRTVQQTLRETGLDPRGLVLEVTETTSMADADRVRGRLEALRALGVRVAIDDFGTGYSSLTHLHQFPVDILKIDRAFVSAMTDEVAAHTIVDASVRLGQALGFEVVAEGVETQEQMESLVALGCDVAQGYFWSRPVSARELTDWADARFAAGAPAADRPRHWAPRQSGALRVPS